MPIDRRELMGTAAAAMVFPLLTGAGTPAEKRPLVIAHRGASGYLPEHTLEAYRLAIALGADYIEPDLVVTKDGHLVARHDRHLSTTTNVAGLAEFAARRTEKDGHDGADWFVEDFTLEEIKRLRARQPFDGRSDAYDDRFTIPTFAEVVELAKTESARRGRKIGLYPEAKAPAFFAERGHDMGGAILNALPDDLPVFIQSFEAEFLIDLATKTERPLIQLIPGSGPFPLEKIAQYAAGIGPNKMLLIDALGADRGMVAAAHERGLAVHPWIFRSDALPKLFKTAQQEYRFFYDLGVDGVFSDFPDTAHAVRLARKF